MRYKNPRFLFRRYEIMRIVRSGESFLEIGPGKLDLAQDLMAKFNDGVLLDFNASDVVDIYDKLPESYKERLKLVISDFTKYEQFDSLYDCVIACEVLEHIQDDEAFLQKANRLLAVGGQLILSVPARQKYWSVDDEIVGHYRRYEKDELFRKLSNVGFSQINIISYGFPFQNLIRYARIGLAKLQYSEKGHWDKNRQSQQSAFLMKGGLFTNILGVIVNKYTIHPFSLIASLFNEKDLGEGYIVSAVRV